MSDQHSTPAIGLWFCIGTPAIGLWFSIIILLVEMRILMPN
jgi:hypothetical protein